MKKRLIVHATIRIIVEIDEEVEVAHVLDELNYVVEDTTDTAKIADTQVIDWDIQDNFYLG